MKKIVLIFFVSIFCATSLFAVDTWHVATNSASDGPGTAWSNAWHTIQDAVDAASDGDTVLVTNGTYLLDAEVAVTNAIRIESMHGSGATLAVAINSNRCFNLGSGIFLSGFTITNGYTATDGGGVICADESAMVSNCVFMGNTAGDEGGGMYRGTAYDCDFINNDSLDDGGGAAKVAPYNCTFIDNTAVNHGGGCSFWDSPFSPSNCVFIGNTAKYGGATYDSDAYDCVFSNNIADITGGAMYQGFDAHNCVFVGNIASNKSGGAIYRVYAYDCYFTNNWADDHGGAIFQTGASNCTFIGNHANITGGAKSWWNDVMQDCVFVSNTSGDGGAVRDGQLYNCIFYDNSAQNGGATSEADLYNCVLYNNSAHDEGGGAHKGAVLNSIIWSNSAPLGSDSYDATLTRCCLSDTETHGVNIDCITNNPQFVGVLDADFHLLVTSPCIDAGSNALVSVFFDFDGVPRPLDGDTNGTAVVDMGCYEYLNRSADSDGDTMTDGWENDNGLNAAVNDALGNPDKDPHNNLQEFIADTDPTDSNDYFCVSSMSNLPPMTVYFESSDNRLYSMIGCSNLVDGSWTNVYGTGPRVGVGGADAMQDTNVPVQGPYYRLEVKLP